jgi:hypothetical protein
VVLRTTVLTLLLPVVPGVMASMVLLPMMLSPMVRSPVVAARPVMALVVVPVVMAVVCTLPLCRGCGRGEHRREQQKRHGDDPQQHPLQRASSRTGAPHGPDATSRLGIFPRSSQHPCIHLRGQTRV